MKTILILLGAALGGFMVCTEKSSAQKKRLMLPDPGYGPRRGVMMPLTGKKVSA